MNPGDSFWHVVQLEDVDHVEVDDVEDFAVLVVRYRDAEMRSNLSLMVILN